METNNVDFSEIRSFKDLRKLSNSSNNNLKENSIDISKLKQRADKAFGDGKFTKAYEYYNQLLLYNPKDYDIIACLIGTALNLGYLDEVFSRADFLIELDDKKAQGYYLKGIAYDILFNFEPAIDLFLKALEFEKDHAKLIVKNLTKTIAKYLNLSEMFQFEDNDEDAEVPNLLRLLEATDLLVKKRKSKIANKVLNYYNSMDIKNFQLKTEFLIVSGNLFKSEQNYDKALLAFEECLYLASMNEDHKLKIKSLVLTSSCYLLKSDLHRVIYFYHKILDIESDLIFNSSNKPTDLNLLQFNDEIINLELRIAIRQNLFTAHYRLGKLRLCCYYLKEMIEIIDNQLNINALNEINSTNLIELFDYIQIKIDASIELCKFYVLFREFIELDLFANRMLEFVETLIRKANLDENLNERPFFNLKYFRIKCYSYLGIAMAGLREFRFSKLCIRKSLALVSKETDVITGKTTSNQRSSAHTELTSKSDYTLDSTRDFATYAEPKLLTLLKVEMLMNASDATAQIMRTFKEMKNIDFGILSDFKAQMDEFEENELKIVIKSYEQRIEYAKEAYIHSKSLIDPNLRIQATFNLAISLYDNELYQSAGYYFSECLNISSVLLKTNQDDKNEFNYLTDVRPDYHLESAVYLAKCQLIMDYFKTESIVKLTDDFEPQNSSKDLAQPIESIYNKLLKSNETICSRLIKWKLNETNRTSFSFNNPDLVVLKPERESERLLKILEICTDCLVYTSYKLNKHDECLFYIEHNKYLVNLDSNDLLEIMPKLKRKDLLQNSFELLGTLDELKERLSEMKSRFVFYKFIFDTKLLYVFYTSESGAIEHHAEIKLSLVYNVNELKVSSFNKKLNNSELDYFSRKFELIQNEWIKNNLNYYECRDVPNFSELELKNLRYSSRNKERKFYSNLNKKKENENKENDKNEISKPIEFRDLDLYRELVEKNLEKLDNINKSQQQQANHVPSMLHLDQQRLETEFDSIYSNLFKPLFIDPLEDLITKSKLESKFLLINFKIESQYSKLLVYALNRLNEQNEFKIYFNIVLDSFLMASRSVLIAADKEIEVQNELDLQRKKILQTPNRAKKISKSKDSTNSIKVSKLNINPRYTSNPQLTHLMLNEEPDKDYILIRNDHYQRAKNRLDSAVGTLISNTFSEADAKRSYLEVPAFKQVHKMEKCSAIGCPEMPKAYYITLNKIDKFLVNGLEQLTEIAKQMHANPIFSTKMTKQEVLNLMEASTVLFLSTFSTNESDTALICSETLEYPNSIFELDKYCKINSADLNLIKMYQCKLLILNSYSIVHNRARFKLAKKIISTGCQNVLFVLTPLPDQLMTKFYTLFLDNLKKEQIISIAYTDALATLNALIDSNILKNLINASFCMISSKHTTLSLNEIAKSMLQSKIDNMIDDSSVNQEAKISILSPTFKPLIEKTLIDLQTLFKLLLNQLISDSLTYISFKQNENLKNIFYYLYDLISKAVSYIKMDKVAPEKLSELIETNTNAKNILFCLGFNCTQSSSSRVRDQNDSFFVSSPDKRYLDLNIRAVHIMSALIEICFEKSIDNRSSISEKSENSINQELRIEASYINQFYDKKISNNDERIEIKIKTIIFNLQALLPITDRNLLTALIDIIALTKFSSEIMLSLSDQSVYYAFNYYEKNTRLNRNVDYVNLIDKDIFTWSNKSRNYMSPSDMSFPSYLPLNHSIKFSINNKVANFLFAIGFETVGNWLRFNDIEFNRRVIDLMLKFFTSFAMDRDMTLYKDLNIHVLGQRSAVTKSRYSSMFRTSTSQANERQEDYFKLLVAKPWANSIETRKEMSLKIEFIERFENLCERLSTQRTEALRHYLDYSLKQHEMNTREDNELEEAEAFRVKFKPGANPSKDRIIVNERIKLTYDQVEEIRKYFHKFLQKNLEKIFIEQNEKSQKLLLPLIQTSYAHKKNV